MLRSATDRGRWLDIVNETCKRGSCVGEQCGRPARTETDGLQLSPHLAEIVLDSLP